MTTYGSTGHNLLAGAPGGNQKPVDDRDIFERYGDTHTTGRHEEALDRAHRQQLAAAESYYQGASQQSNLQAAQMRGQTMRANLGALGEGGLAARQAIYGGAMGAYGAGAAGTQAGSEARLSAAEAYMSTQADRARYDMAVAQAYAQRRAAEEAKARDVEAAIAARQASEESSARAGAGAFLGAGGSMMASGGYGYQTGGGYGGQYSATHPDDEHGGGYGKAKYVS